MEKGRKIIHVDMDAFYAAVEQRDNPELRGKPVCVGGGPHGRGVVQTCSYEAREYGIHSAMSSSKALRLCPHAIFVPPRFDVYKEVSDQIREIFHEYTDLVEPVSWDEAYLDVTENKKGMESAEQIAKDILNQINEKTGCTASAGVSFNKFLAKVGSDFHKPFGITIITREGAAEFIDNLPIRKFRGVGKATEKKMKDLGIETGADLKRYSREELRRYFGKSGYYFYNMAHLIDSREVHLFHSRKSIGSERTLHEDLDDVGEIVEILEGISERLTDRMKRYNIAGRTITLKVKYYNFRRISRRTTLREAVDDSYIIMAIIKRLLLKTDIGKRKTRLVGISVSNLKNQSDVDHKQLTLPIEESTI
ncbi:MAG: DNA polymerase IV [Thermoplasmata archaeon]|nr:MAG: DNA polymerase IV [Thermoplasmata archaeon]